LISLFKITNRFETYRVIKPRTAFLAAAARKDLGSEERSGGQFEKDTVGKDTKPVLF
jgi:hypothetical protein